MKRFHVLVPLVGLFLAGCGPGASPFYQRISIDTSTLDVSFHNPIRGIREPQADFYWPFYTADKHCSLDHFDTRRTPRIRYNSFDLDPQGRITSRTKDQVVLSSKFGTFYAHTDYYYAPGSHRTSFWVHAYSNSFDCEPPQISDLSIPQDARLSVVSVIRIFQTPTGYFLVSACYAIDGTLLSVSENHSVGGDCPGGGSTTFERANPKPFGLPSRFPVAAYASGKRDIFEPAIPPSQLDCVNFHYNRNRMVRQDVIRPAELTESRTLSYVVTFEDKALDSVDAGKSFGLNR